MVFKKKKLPDNLRYFRNNNKLFNKIKKKKRRRSNNHLIMFAALPFSRRPEIFLKRTYYSYVSYAVDDVKQNGERKERNKNLSRSHLLQRFE